MGQLYMDAACANWHLRYQIAFQLHTVKWMRQYVSKDEQGKFRDFKVDFGHHSSTISRTAIEIYFEQEGDLTGERLESAIDEYMKRRKIKPFTEGVVIQI